MAEEKQGCSHVSGDISEQKRQNRTKLYLCVALERATRAVIDGKPTLTHSV